MSLQLIGKPSIALAVGGSYALLYYCVLKKRGMSSSASSSKQGGRTSSLKARHTSSTSRSATAQPDASVEMLGPVFSMKDMREAAAQLAKAAEERKAHVKEDPAHAHKHKKSMLYTRTGDAGQSSLYTGERRIKTDDTFEALGATDELNATVGLAREHCLLAGNGLHDLLADIQSRLFDVGAELATPRNKSSDDKRKETTFDPRSTAALEAAIDELDSRLPPLTGFILPSGGLSAAHLHLSRTVCRRAERRALPLVLDGRAGPEVGRYLNRLSDFFFAAARYASMVEKHPETEWQKLEAGQHTNER